MIINHKRVTVEVVKGVCKGELHNASIYEEDGEVFYICQVNGGQVVWFTSDYVRVLGKGGDQ